MTTAVVVVVVTWKQVIGWFVVVLAHACNDIQRRNEKKENKNKIVRLEFDMNLDIRVAT